MERHEIEEGRDWPGPENIDKWKAKDPGYRGSFLYEVLTLGATYTLARIGTLRRFKPGPKERGWFAIQVREESNRQGFGNVQSLDMPDESAILLAKEIIRIAGHDHGMQIGPTAQVQRDHVRTWAEKLITAILWPGEEDEVEALIAEYVETWGHPLVDREGESTNLPDRDEPKPFAVTGLGETISRRVHLRGLKLFDITVTRD